MGNRKRWFSQEFPKVLFEKNLESWQHQSPLLRSLLEVKQGSDSDSPVLLYSAEKTLVQSLEKYVFRGCLPMSQCNGFYCC